MSVSIITPVLNNRKEIGDCLRSVRTQTYGLIEHLILDGGSTDGTLDVVRELGGPMTRLICGTDMGLYDALNKGISASSGEVVGVLHADDFYEHDEVIRSLVSAMNSGQTDSCYGDLLIVDREDTGRVVRYWKTGRYRPGLFLRGWMPPHPSFFVRRSVYERFGGYRTDLGSAADYELMLRFLHRYAISTCYLPDVLVRMRSGGMSDSGLMNRVRANLLDRKAWKVNGLRPYPWTLFFKPLRKLGQFFALH